MRYNDSPRVRAWHRIQNQAPDLAAYLRRIEARFGRPRDLEVEIGGEIVWPPGRETPSPDQVSGANKAADSEQ